MWNLFDSPLFAVGDYAIVQAKDCGIVLVHPKTKEEVYARSYDGVPGLQAYRFKNQMRQLQ